VHKNALFIKPLTCAILDAETSQEATALTCWLLEELVTTSDGSSYFFDADATTSAAFDEAAFFYVMEICDESRKCKNWLFLTSTLRACEAANFDLKYIVVVWTRLYNPNNNSFCDNFFQIWQDVYWRGFYIEKRDILTEIFSG
jgi:hypothetical protein